MLLLSAKGFANILFHNRASELVQLVEYEEDDVSVGRLAKRIVTESKELAPTMNTYQTWMSKGIAAEAASPTLMKILSFISKDFDSTMPTLLIGNMITSVITNQPTALRIVVEVEVFLL